MELILLRHAEAEDFGEHGDLSRSLTRHGEEQARHIGKWLDQRLPKHARILASPARRTVQTAEGIGRAFETHDDLAPGALVQDVLQVAGWLDEAASGEQTVVIVGHQPTLGQVVARLLTGRSNDWSVRKASAWWFKRRAGSVVLLAMMTAELT